jgi:hypothetical protein
LRPPEKTTLHGLILNNPSAAPKDIFKAGLQNREDLSPLKAKGAIVRPSLDSRRAPGAPKSQTRE